MVDLTCVVLRINLSYTLTWQLQIEKCRKMIETSKKSLEEGTHVFHAIEACNEVLDGHGSDIGPALRHECFFTRAALLLKVR